MWKEAVMALILSFTTLYVFQQNAKSNIAKLYNLWEPPTLKQELANQCRPQQSQRPLSWVLLVTVYKDADLQHASQSQLCLHRDSLSGAQTATASHLAATP
jgi:hypothetical protein